MKREAEAPAKPLLEKVSETDDVWRGTTGHIHAAVKQPSEGMDIKCWWCGHAGCNVVRRSAKGRDRALHDACLNAVIAEALDP